MDVISTITNLFEHMTWTEKGLMNASFSVIESSELFLSEKWSEDVWWEACTTKLCISVARMFKFCTIDKYISSSLFDIFIWKKISSKYVYIYIYVNIFLYVLWVKYCFSIPNMSCGIMFWLIYDDRRVEQGVSVATVTRATLRDYFRQTVGKDEFQFSLYRFVVIAYT